MSCAARLRRLDEKAEIIVIERGEYISFANCGLPYYVGGVIKNRGSLLLQSPQAMKARFNIEVRTLSEAVEIFPSLKEIEIRDLTSGRIYREDYDYLLLSPGAAPVDFNMAGSGRDNVFRLRNIPDTDQIRSYILEHQPQKSVVIGGGFIGIEMAEMLYTAGLKVTLVEASNQILNMLDPEMAAFVQKYLRQLGVDLKLGRKVLELEGEPFIKNIKLDDGQELPTELVVIGLGVKPETWLADKCGLKIGDRGGILVDEYLRTSDPYIFAAGDAIEVRDVNTSQNRHFPMAGPANRQGWLAASSIAGEPRPYRGIQGTSIIKVMDLNAAATGINEKQLKANVQSYLCCHLHPASHASYYPGANLLHMKLIFAPEDGRILGAQIVGSEGVDKRIDVIATAIYAGLNVHQLQELELAYAPPFSSAKDPVNMAAYVAGNILDGKVSIIYWPDVEEKLKSGAMLIDVRTPAETSSGMVPGAINIPVDELRQRLDEIPRGKELMVYCRVGQRSYIASRILRENGYDVRNISGGYLLYEAWSSEKKSN